MSHTPGPWRVTEDLVTDCPAIVDSLGRRIAVLPLSCPQGGETKACNARLIAAAPEMLEAMEEIEALIRESRGVVGYHLNGNEAAWEELDLKVDAIMQKVRGEEGVSETKG